MHEFASMKGEFMKRALSTAAAMLLPAILLGACDGSGGSTAQRKAATVTVPLRTTVVALAIDTYLPIALGYWREEGLDVTLQSFDGSSDALQPVLIGSAVAATAMGTSTIVAANTAGSDLKCFVAGITGRLLY